MLHSDPLFSFSVAYACVTMLSRLGRFSFNPFVNFSASFCVDLIRNIALTLTHGKCRNKVVTGGDEDEVHISAVAMKSW